MNFDKLTFQTDTVPFFDEDGNKLDEFHLKTRIMPLHHRRSSIGEDGLIYKGTGTIYSTHILYDLPEDMTGLRQLEMFTSPYDRYIVCKEKLVGKHGIFSFQHQPCFTDCEGGCGKKEQNIIPMQERFERSAIAEIVDVIPLPVPDHYIYAFRLREVKGNYRDTIDLIEYVLTNDLNTGWDKNLWSDIESFGYVRDIADWFVSGEFRHKLGTVYALLKSISTGDKYTYSAIVHDLTDLGQLPMSHTLYIAALIVRKYCPECVNADLSSPSKEVYTYLYEELYSGKACCHLENDAEWDFVRDVYRKSATASIKAACDTLLRQQVANMRYFF